MPRYEWVAGYKCRCVVKYDRKRDALSYCPRHGERGEWLERHQRKAPLAAKEKWQREVGEMASRGCAPDSGAAEDEAGRERQAMCETDWRTTND